MITKRNNVIAILLAMLVAVAMMPMTAFPAYAADDYTTEKVVTGADLEIGVTVVPNGNIYAINNGNMYVYNSSGSSLRTIPLPSANCGNLCSDANGYVFAHDTKYDNNKAIYVFSPGSSSYKTLYAKSACLCLATDSNGYLYSINSTGLRNGKKATKIFRSKISSLTALSSGAEFTWEEEFQPDYDPPASSGICYPGYFDVDSAGNAYIADLGTDANGSTSYVNGIYKCNLYTGQITALYFTNGTGNLNWVHGVTADDFGNVAVVGRNSYTIAIFRNGSTTADKLITGIKGFCEDLASDQDGNIYYITNHHGDATNNGVSKITLNNVKTTGVSLATTQKTIKEGASFTMSPTVSPSNATNKGVLYSSSNTSVATVSATGTVKGVNAGSATITVKTVQGGFTAQCKVTVEKAPSGSADGSDGGSATVDVVKVGTKATVNAGTVSITSVSGKTVAFTKAKNKKSIVVPDTVKINNKTYKVTQVNAKAFTGKKIRTVTIGKNVKKIKAKAFYGSKATKIIVKTQKLTKKASVKGSLKGSKVKTVQVKVGSKTLNKKFVKKYKKVFTKSNAGKKVTVK